MAQEYSRIIYNVKRPGPMAFPVSIPMYMYRIKTRKFKFGLDFFQKAVLRFKAKPGIENYQIVFENIENLDAYQLEGPLLSDNTKNYGQNTDTLQLDNSLFENDCLIFKNLNSRSVNLVNKTTGQKINVQFDGFNFLLIWTVPGAPFVCIEPWCGVTDNVNTTKQLPQKEGIEKIEKGGNFYRIHSFEII